MTDNQQLKFGLHIPVSKIHTALKWVVVINILFLFGTWLHHSRIIMPEKKAMQILLSQFNFAKENVVASWYSSILFFISGITAATCFWADMQRTDNARGRILNFGWLVIAGIFIMLSFDEMGSFHEMIGETAAFKKAGGGSKGAGWYFFYALILAVAIFMITFFVMKFKGNKLAFVLTILGVLLFISNPFQEKFEIHTWRSSVDPSTWRRPVFFLLLEEGSEIFASFCFLYSFATYAIAAAPGTGLLKIKTLQLESGLHKNFILYLTGFAFILGSAMLIIHLNAWNFSRDDNGIPHNWPPAATAFLGFAAGIYLYFKFHQQQQQRKVYLLLAICCLLISIYFGANMYGYRSGSFGKIKYAVLAITVLAGLAAVIKLNGPGIYAKVLITGWVLLMGLSVFSSRFYPSAFGYLAAVSLVLGLLLHYQDKASGIMLLNSELLSIKAGLAEMK
ncbi:MAG: hypothetical protein IPP72_10610 [Chitinophagaceae bacterium]|nr:hypothetical protein [Chitinophagaceae bacterium]